MRAVGQLANLARDDRKAQPGFARVRRLDGGIERKQIRLGRDFIDQRENRVRAFERARHLADDPGHDVDLFAHAIERLH